MENSKTAKTENDELEISLYDLIVAILRKKFMIVGIVVIAIVLALVYLHFVSPVYQASATIMVSSLNGDSSVTDLLTGALGGNQSRIETEVALISSRRTVELALESLDLSKYTTPDGIPYDELEVPLTASRFLAGDAISISTVTDTNIVEITVRDTSAEFCQDFANAIADSFNNVLTGFSRSTATASIDFINSQIPAVQSEFEQASQALADFQRENGVLQATAESQISLARYNYLVSRRAPLLLEAGEADAIIEAIAVNSSYDELTGLEAVQNLMDDIRSTQEEIMSYDLISASVNISSSRSNTENILSISQRNRYYTLTNRLENSELRLVEVLTRNLSALSPQAASTYASAVAQKLVAESEISLIDTLIESENEVLETVPALERELARLTASVEVYQAMTVSLMQMEMEAHLRDAAISDNVVVIDSALLPTRPVSPNSLMILAIAFVLGGFVAVAIALLLEFSDKSIFSIEELQKNVPDDIPILGWIPMLKEQDKDRYAEFVVHTHPNSIESERFKHLASNIIFGQDKKNRAITVCSTEKSEGKTFVMANIALALVQNGYKVLLVDGDLRKPSVEQFFNIEHQERGLVDIIINNENLDDCIIQPIADVENLHMLPCGTRPAIPSMIYSSADFGTLVEDLKKRYDIILFDAPPLVYASELLARAGVSNKYELNSMFNDFKIAGTKIIGLCLNAIIMGHGYKGYGSYYYYYYYSSDSDNVSIVKRIPWYSSRKMYYRSRYKKDIINREKNSYSSERKIRPTHPFNSSLDLGEDE